MPSSNTRRRRSGVSKSVRAQKQAPKSGGQRQAASQPVRAGRAGAAKAGKSRQKAVSASVGVTAGNRPDSQAAAASSGVSWLEIDAEYAGQRLDNFLFNHWKGLPKTKVYQLMRKGYVRLDKKRVKPSTRLYGGAKLRLPPVFLPGQEDGGATVKPFEVDQLRASIIHEDDALMVINKPAGWAVHGGSGVKLGVIEALRQMFPNEKHLELVHRLDRETSGCLMVAKKRSALKALHESFRDHTIEKVYWVLVSGAWPKRKTVVRDPLKRFVAGNGERFVRVDHEFGQPARTDFEIIEQFPQATLLRAHLHTGRTHQIRVHCAAQGCPVVGDLKYGEAQPWAKALGARQFLHCIALKPPALDGLPQWDGFTAGMDERLEALLAELRSASA